MRIGFGDRRQPVPTVHGVDLEIHPGECLAIVGESGSGKSVTARTLVGLTGDNAHITADQLDDFNSSDPAQHLYGGFADITSLVATGGSGNYTVAKDLATVEVIAAAMGSKPWTIGEFGAFAVHVGSLHVGRELREDLAQLQKLQKGVGAN